MLLRLTCGTRVEFLVALQCINQKTHVAQCGAMLRTVSRIRRDHADSHSAASRWAHVPTVGRFNASDARRRPSARARHARRVPQGSPSRSARSRHTDDSLTHRRRGHARLQQQKSGEDTTSRSAQSPHTGGSSPHRPCCWGHAQQKGTTSRSARSPHTGGSCPHRCHRDHAQQKGMTSRSARSRHTGGSCPRRHHHGCHAWPLPPYDSPSRSARSHRTRGSCPLRRRQHTAWLPALPPPPPSQQKCGAAASSD